MAQLEHITPEQIEQYGVVAAPDRLTGKARDNKMIFDRLVRELVAVVVNDIIDKTNELLTAEDVREENERNRVAAENLRVQAEKLRVQAEQARVTAENERVQAEANRVAAELLRVKAEQLRASAEQSRVQAEQGRVTAEQAREQAEKDREDTTNGIVAQATDQAKTAESWAIGGTGTRPGEDTNNAKYWAGQAENAAGGSYADKQLSNLDTSQQALANLGAGVRPNLLDNAYFVGGGSQQGGEQLPVNQIGATSWSTAGNVFDRWEISPLSSGPVGTLDLEPDGAYLSNTTGTSLYFNQIVPAAVSKRLAGKTVTLSFLATELSGNWGIGERGQTSPVFSSAGLLSVTFVWNDSISVKRVQMWPISRNPGTAKVVAAKLEEGEGQTLAYKDSTGAWKLLPQPDMDYGTQLLKCQRYLWASSVSANGYSVLGHSIALNATTAYLLVDLPVTPRKVVPNIAADISTSLYIRNTSSISGAVTAMDVDSVSRGSSKVLIVLTGTFIAGTTYLVYSYGNNPLILSWQL